jgi:hypothetical protein
VTTITLEFRANRGAVRRCIRYTAAAERRGYLSERAESTPSSRTVTSVICRERGAMRPWSTALDKKDNMTELKSRVDRIVRELASIQEDLNHRMVEDATNPTGTALRPAEQDLDALRDLKSVVDQMRQFLWIYLQVVNGGSEASERTLQLLRQVSKQPRVLHGNSPLTFLERLNALTEYALVHYREDGDGKPN